MVSCCLKLVFCTPNLTTKIIPATIAWLKPSGKFPMDMRISPLKHKIMLESNPLKSRIFVRRLAVYRRSHDLSTKWRGARYRQNPKPVLLPRTLCESCRKPPICRRIREARIGKLSRARPNQVLSLEGWIFRRR